MKQFLMLGVLAGLAVTACAAPPAAPKVMRGRIQQGVQSGSLTGPETARIRQQQAQLHRQVVRSRNDGPGITPREAARIGANAHQNSRLLYRLKHNDRTR